MKSNKDYSQYITRKTLPRDKRHFLIRLLLSISPKIEIVRNKDTNKLGFKIGIKGGTDF